MKKPPTFGTCKLTLRHGKFVKSHLLPLSLTKPEVRGAPLIQQGSGKYPSKRWSSWYDRHLVIDVGEKILSDLDDWAIRELRRLHLVWSGWGPMVKLVDNDIFDTGSGAGIRRVRVGDPVRLRLFVLSLLWRAAASDLPEFSEVDLPPDDLEELRLLLISNDPGRIDFYPASFSQLSTRVVVHNLSPLAQTKKVPAIETEPSRDIPIFRFYLDDLIIHVHRQPKDDGYTAALGNSIVGAGPELIVVTMPFETSWEALNLAYNLVESLTKDDRKR